MPPCTVEFSEICPSGKGYIPVEGAWMFGQTTYTGNLPKTLLPNTTYLSGPSLVPQEASACRPHLSGCF